MPGAHLVYLASGRDEFLAQALYSAWTALAWKGSLPLRIHVYTDRPGYFAALAPAVEPVLLDAGRTRDWRGPWDFVYRMKAKVVEDVARRFPDEPVLFADADTFWLGDLGQAFARIGERSAVMHLREYHAGTHGSPQMLKFRRRMGRARFRGQPIDVQAWMWNSGALGLHPSHFPLLADWIAFMDEVHPANRKPIVEQFSIGWLLQRRLDLVSPCDDVLFHYFDDKDRHLAAIGERLPRLQQLPREEALAWLRAEPLRIEGAPPPTRKATLLQRLRTILRERLPLQRTPHG
ncbi:MAG: hypothetical protein WCC48_14925 [Anaeromyxobacteraceae bacterium]